MNTKSSTARKQTPNHEDIGAQHLAFYVKDVKKGVEYLKSKGLLVIGEPMKMPSGDTQGETWVHFVAPWGQELEIVESLHGKGYESNHPKVKLWSPANSQIVRIQQNTAEEKDQITSILRTYFEIWNESDPVKREPKMKKVFSESFFVADEKLVANSYEELNEFITQIQSEHSGFKFFVKSFEVHHGLARAFF